MVMKLIGLGWNGYVHDRFNVFDGFMVIVGLIEIIMTASNSSGGNFSSIMVLRAFRLLRIFKLARRWKSLRILLKKMA